MAWVRMSGGSGSNNNFDGVLFNGTFFTKYPQTSFVGTNASITSNSIRANLSLTNSFMYVDIVGADFSKFNTMVVNFSCNQTSGSGEFGFRSNGVYTRVGAYSPKGASLTVQIPLTSKTGMLGFGLGFGRDGTTITINSIVLI